MSIKSGEDHASEPKEGKKGRFFLLSGKIVSAGEGFRNVTILL